MATLSRKPDPALTAQPFLTGRLGPIALDHAKEKCAMSIVFLQGGGLSPSQMDQVPLENVRLFPILARLMARIWPASRRNPG